MASTIKARSVFGSAKQAMSSSADIIVEVAVATSELVGLAKDQIIVARATNALTDVADFVFEQIEVCDKIEEKMADESLSESKKLRLARALARVEAIEL